MSFDRITCDPNRLDGQPCIRDLRLTVRRVLEAMATYPDWDELRLEDRAEDPTMIFTITDSRGEVVRRITGPTGKGFHRIAWDMHYPSLRPASASPWKPRGPWDRPPRGHLAAIAARGY